MCGRYYADFDTEEKVRELIHDAKKPLRTGDIHPSETATILSSAGSNLIAEDMVWGFPGFKGSDLLINARAETITERPAFKDSVLSRRCIIPAKGFYEWSPRKEKYQFEEPGTTLFMAGCFDPQHRFVIITTAANASVLPVHERMPLLLAEEEIEAWICEADSMTAILQKVPKPLKSWTEYRQMTLFDQDE
ncbi:MAG: SOS response-associated peptidase [Lachnospiraceae bacterium]|nr:SOS response-associated peptidase [Lachnospiraceae bacterium]